MDLTLLVAGVSIALVLAVILVVAVLSRLDRPRPPSEVTRIVAAVQRRKAARGEDCP
ncbi:hypothetical protein [Methylobacterium sp. Leaf94]|uniref:hypothetical protein n=1 Tax=Methylobacterium sp. Leaf94 TaxID=1736250 RepID=UPI000A74E1A4|nr:hypothetical protein [Methylobacterium sp. Leaf94]